MYKNKKWHMSLFLNAYVGEDGTTGEFLLLNPKKGGQVFLV